MGPGAADARACLDRAPHTHLDDAHAEAGQVLQGGVHAGLERRGVEQAAEQRVVVQQGPLLGQELAQLHLQAPVELELTGGGQQLRQALLRGLPGDLSPVQSRHHHLQPLLGHLGLQGLCQP